MEQFEFNGDWDTTINLKYLKPYYIENGVGIKRVNQSDDIQLWIGDRYGDMSPDPSPEQMATIAFLLNAENQLAIIDSFIAYLKEEIYPFYQKNVFDIQEYPESYLKVNNRADFYRYFNVNAISITNIEDTESRIYTLYFGTQLLDDEHGLTVSLNGTQCLRHGAGDGSMIYTKEEEQENVIKRKAYQDKLDKEVPIIYQPHPKYNKLKPWQEAANRRFISNAYRTYNDEEFLQAMIREQIDLKNKKYYYQRAKEDNRTLIIQYFEDQQYF